MLLILLFVPEFGTTVGGWGIGAHSYGSALFATDRNRTRGEGSSPSLRAFLTVHWMSAVERESTRPACPEHSAPPFWEIVLA